VFVFVSLNIFVLFFACVFFQFENAPLKFVFFLCLSHSRSRALNDFQFGVFYFLMQNKKQTEKKQKRQFIFVFDFSLDLNAHALKICK